MSPTDLEVCSRNTRELIEGMMQAENQADWDRWRELVAEDVIIDHPTFGPHVGIEANLALVRRFREAVDDYRRDIVDVVCDDSGAAFRFAVTGVLARPVGDTQPTGAPFEIAGAAFVTTWGGRIVRVVEIVTTNSLRQMAGGSGGSG